MILGKGLVGRVSEVLGDMVSDSQSVFVINRQIIDATHIANKVVRDVTRHGRQALFLS